MRNIVPVAYWVDCLSLYFGLVLVESVVLHWQCLWELYWEQVVVVWFVVGVRHQRLIQGSLIRHHWVGWSFVWLSRQWVLSLALHWNVETLLSVVASKVHEKGVQLQVCICVETCGFLELLSLNRLFTQSTVVDKVLYQRLHQFYPIYQDDFLVPLTDSSIASASSSCVCNDSLSTCVACKSVSVETLCKKASNHHANLPLEMSSFTL